jgi:phosphonate transport system substrate-binding protein
MYRRFNLRLICLYLLLVTSLVTSANAASATSPLSESFYDWLAEQWHSLNSEDPNRDYQPSFSTQNPQALKEYIIGIHPLHNPKRLFEIYGPIIDYINVRMPDVVLKLEASRNYDEFDKKLYTRHFDIAMPNPYQTLLSLQHGYRVFGKMADDADFRGIILIRTDSGIQQVSDLKGKAVAFPAATALAATMMPQYYLQTHGLDVMHDVDTRYVGSQESSITNVLLGHTAAAATWPVPWKLFVAEHPDQAAQLEIKWQTEPLINVGWVVRDDVPDQLLTRFAKNLFSLQDDEAGRKLLQAVPISNFEAASDETYAPIRQFLDEFNRTVRNIEQ